MEEIKGYIEHIIYKNPDNGYTVLNLVSEAREITCVGFFRYADEGENVKLKGEYISHQIYGDQFKVAEYEISEPDDIGSIERYLGSGAIKGIGKALAGRIVSRFKEDTFRVMEEEPELLAQIKGISDGKAREIAVQVIEKAELRRIMVFLQQYGVSNSLANRIYSRYGQETYKVISENPYRLAEDIKGVGFRTADEIAARAGIHTDSDYRTRSGILYILSCAIGEGHCFLPKDELMERASELLSLPGEIIWIQASNLMMDKKIIIKEGDFGTRVYPPVFYNMERSVAGMLSSLYEKDDEDEEVIRTRLKKLSRAEGIELEQLQEDAVIKAVKNGVVVVTGGPGTGKTTIINMMIRYFESEAMDIYLAAPTGRAAKRMTEATGYEASTIQRLLHLTPTDDGEFTGLSFEKNEEDPLEADVVIIDEMSMVDLPLFHALLKALVPGVRLILVGDTNQLPSVGPGSVLKDVIDSGCFPVVRLKKVFRQAEESDIVMNAHRINEGRSIKLDNKSRDFFFLKRDNVDVIMKNMIVLIKDKLPGYVNAKPFDIQVLTPMRKGTLGIESLNPILQKYLNPPGYDKKEKEYANTTFREGDKVMQIKNDYRLEWEIRSSRGVVVDKGLGIFNGDMGILRSIDDFRECITVEFEEGRKVDYPFGQLDELELAYAVTVHKSQGSEYPAVIIPLLKGPKPLFNRNLLYTAVTRARSCVTIIGSREQIDKMIENNEEHMRYTSLKERISEINDRSDRSDDGYTFSQALPGLS